MNDFADLQRSFLRCVSVLALATCAAAQIPTPTNTPSKTPTNAPTNSSSANNTNTANNAPAQTAPKFLRYVRAGDNGAHARNVYDKQGLIVLEVPAGGLLAVHGERSGWYEVEAPGGFSVWVWGQYLGATSDPNVLQVTGSNVNMRPLPSNDVASLPLGQLLDKGDRVRVIGRKDTSKPLSEDWVNVWSRPGVRAWVLASETQPLPTEADGAALWSKAVLEARPTLARDDATKGAVAQADALKPENKEVSQALAEADAALATERKAEQEGRVPDYAKARAGYEKVLAMVTTGATADLARSRVDLCKGYGEAYALRTEMERKRDAVDAAVKKREADMDRARNKGVYEGRFDARGWLERRMLPGNQPIYILRWAGDPHAELVCTSGRYDLSLFLDYELGINGNELRGPVTGATVELSRPRELDVSRIEVLAGRDTSHL